ncbi:hypothetical protein ACH4MG_04140 [Streptomyces sp. NPDC017454]|uniref:hypothetical protein n=1 Tax=Streptomyces sp. NPDC017454 TaxID=3364997 RepID=UPI003791D485
MEVTMVPHPGLQVGDTVTVTSGRLSGALGTVEAFRLPYTPGEMTATVRAPL